MSSGQLLPPRKLLKSDNRAEFDSGAIELDTWFAQYAWQNQRAANAVVYVSMLGDRVVGYYAIAAAGVSKETVEAEFARGRPRDIPCVLLARLAVDRRAQGRGVGQALFRDVIERTLAASDALGAAALLIHCRNEKARQFYMRLADVIESPVKPLHLMLPVRTIQQLLKHQPDT